MCLCGFVVVVVVVVCFARSISAFLVTLQMADIRWTDQTAVNKKAPIHSIIPINDTYHRPL